LLHMVRLIDDLLDVSRISRGILELRKQPIDLTSALDTAIEASRPLIEASGHKLIVRRPAETMVVDADVVRLAQVFSNLLNNAAKYTNPSGQIEFIVEPQGSTVRITVSDNGIGIPAEMLPRVFDMFSQVDHGPRSSSGGLGIGLTLAKRLVEMHGGRIDANSGGHGEGSEFVVRLPLCAETPFHPRSADLDKMRMPLDKFRLLIVDDLADTAESMAMLFGAMGHEVQTAYDGEEALAAAQRFRPDVVLLDIGLPKLSGYEVCRRIREQPWGDSMFLIALTGWGQEQDRRRTEAAGFDHHLVKPVSSDTVLELIASLGLGQSARSETDGPEHPRAEAAVS